MLIEPFIVNDINDFNGPLDLLLNLIRIKEIEITTFSLAEITGQYIEYINQVKSQSIEIASDYLAIAAYLVELKSRLLIPNTQTEIEDNYEARERDEFIARLQEYHKIKEVSEYFKNLQKQSIKMISKPKSLIKITKIDDDKLPLAPNNLDIDKFAKIFLKVLEKQKKNMPVEKNVQIVEISPEEVSSNIKSFLADKKNWLELEDLIENDMFSIGMLVVVFVSILELAKEQYLEIKQDDVSVYVRKVG